MVQNSQYLSEKQLTGLEKYKVLLPYFSRVAALFVIKVRCE